LETLLQTTFIQRSAISVFLKYYIISISWPKK
jgi:hypothetical protein